MSGARARRRTRWQARQQALNEAAQLSALSRRMVAWSVLAGLLAIASLSWTLWLMAK